MPAATKAILSSTTMEEFQVPEDIGDPCALQIETAGRFCASKDLPSLRDEHAGELNDRLDGVGSCLANGVEDCLSQQDNFDEMFSFVRYVIRLSRECGVVVVVLLGLSATAGAKGQENLTSVGVCVKTAQRAALQVHTRCEHISVYEYGTGIARRATGNSTVVPMV